MKFLETHEVEIEKLVAGGNGLARHRGKVIFVPYSAPGERHLVEVTATSKDYAEARSLENLSSSPSRREAPCSYFGQCGGCSIMHLLPQAQLEVKKTILLESLERGGGINYKGKLGMQSGIDRGYRNRLRFHVAERRGGFDVGFHPRGSKEIIDIETCLQGTEATNAAISRCRHWLQSNTVIAKKILAIELQEGLDPDKTNGSKRIVGRILVSNREDGRLFTRKRLSALVQQTGLDGIAVSTERAIMARFGCQRVCHQLGALTIEQTIGSFFQTNRFLLKELAEAVMPPDHVARAIDLHCGVGFFSLLLASNADWVVGVEASSVSVRDARENARRNAIVNVDFLRQKAAEYVQEFALRPQDYVVVDPPRQGLDLSLLRNLAASSLHQLRYVSCNAPTLARDASRLIAAGFVLEYLEIFDLFPNTHHFETVAFFRRD